MEGGDAIDREMILEQSGVAEARQGGRMDNPGLVGGGLVPPNSGTLDLGEGCRGERCLPWWTPFAEMDHPLAPTNTEGTPFAKQFLAIRLEGTMVCTNGTSSYYQLLYNR